MKLSVVVTARNEESTIGILLESLLRQSKKPDEIIVIDSASKDKTVEIIRHFQKKDKRIKLLIEKCSRGRGRNLGVELAKNEILAMTDAGCVTGKNWLKRLTSPFATGVVDISAGFYKMTGETPFQKAEAVYLGVLPDDFNVKFMPSTRSIAFTKKIWERVGGFPEKINTAEDTIFNFKAIAAGANIARVKNARVEWKMPESLTEFKNKIYEYAKGDAKSGIWFNPKTKLLSHNIKVVFIFMRYILALSVFLYAILASPILLVVLFVTLVLYCYRSYTKAGVWGIVLQFVSDFAVMEGFIAGILKR